MESKCRHSGCRFHGWWMFWIFSMIGMHTWDNYFNWHSPRGFDARIKSLEKSK